MSFEIASRNKYRFDTIKGSLTTEDLWDLPLTTTTSAPSLDTIAKSLNRKIKETADESFVAPVTKTNEELTLKLELVKHIISVRQEENAKKLAAKNAKEKKDRILEIISRKQDKQLEDTPVEELEKMLFTL